MSMIKNYHSEELRMYKRENRMLKDKLNELNMPEKLTTQDHRESSFMRRVGYGTYDTNQKDRPPRARSSDAYSTKI